MHVCVTEKGATLSLCLYFFFIIDLSLTHQQCPATIFHLYLFQLLLGSSLCHQQPHLIANTFLSSLITFSANKLLGTTTHVIQKQNIYAMLLLSNLSFVN